MPPAPIEARLPLQTSLGNYSGMSQDQEYSPMLSRPKSLAFHGGSTSSTSIFSGRSPVDNERRLPSLAVEADDGTPSTERRRSLANASRYKTELCRPFMENGVCKYGEKCQFAHGHHEVRAMARHPKYKTEYCRTFHSQGFCPYGPRCHFIHDPLEKRERCTPTTPRSFSVSSPITPFPAPGRSPSPPSPPRTADEQSFNVRRVHKPVQRQFSSPAAMGRGPVSSIDDEVFRRTPPSSPPLAGRFSVSSLQDAIDVLVESPRCPNKSTGFISPSDNNSPGRRLPVFNTISQGN